jgi:hypothetical protein
MARKAKRSAGVKRRRPVRRSILHDHAARTPAGETDLTTVTNAKAEFDAAHEAGMDALRRHDYGALARAIDREHAVIAKMAMVLASRRRKQR